MRLTDGEYELLSQRAADDGVSIQRLLVENALAGDGWSVGQRKALATSFFQARLTLFRAASNLNQMVRWSHRHEREHPEIDEAIAAVEDAAVKLRRPLDALFEDPW